MKLTIYTARCTGMKSNCSYPDRHEITSAEGLKAAAGFDHVCAEYKGNHRGIENFLRSNVLVMDIDNDHTEEPGEWITFDKLEDLFGDMNYAVVPSRHHMLPKDDYGPRPRMHIYFEIAETTDPDYYAGLKEALQRKYPFFDDNALDAARFIFGSDGDDIVWHEGWTTIDEETEVVIHKEEAELLKKKPAGRSLDGTIKQGNRNNTLSHFAVIFCPLMNSQCWMDPSAFCSSEVSGHSCHPSMI